MPRNRMWRADCPCGRRSSVFRDAFEWLFLLWTSVVTQGSGLLIAPSPREELGIALMLKPLWSGYHTYYSVGKSITQIIRFLGHPFGELESGEWWKMEWIALDHRQHRWTCEWHLQDKFAHRFHTPLFRAGLNNWSTTCSSVIAKGRMYRILDTRIPESANVLSICSCFITVPYPPERGQQRHAGQHSRWIANGNYCLLYIFHRTPRVGTILFRRPWVMATASLGVRSGCPEHVLLMTIRTYF